MKILLLGQGGREHALAWKLAQSPSVTALDVAPGNGGTAKIPLAAGGATHNIPGAAITDPDAMAALAAERGADFVIIGPEAPLAAGVSDRLRAEGLSVFGPSQAAAQLETSKAFAKAVLGEAGAPTAAYVEVDTPEAARDALTQFTPPYVLKADGLAAGKGVVLADTLAEAEAAAHAMLGGQFGAASARLVIEEFMAGEEVSFFALGDGTTAMPLAAAQDHKRAFDGDEGPNTGGMGCYSPAPIFTAKDEAFVMDALVRPVLRVMAARGAPYVGALYVGLMMTDEGPKVVEFNARFGDPECQALMLRLDADLAELLHATATGRLADTPAPSWSSEAAACVVMAAKGYPGAYAKGEVIVGADAGPGDGGRALVFHAGTERDDALRTISAGGRVLNAMGRGDDIADAVKAAYARLSHIRWEGGFYRRDIGKRAGAIPAPSRVSG